MFSIYKVGTMPQLDHMSVQRHKCQNTRCNVTQKLHCVLWEIFVSGQFSTVTRQILHSRQWLLWETNRSTVVNNFTNCETRVSWRYARLQTFKTRSPSWDNSYNLFCVLRALWTNLRTATLWDNTTMAQQHHGQPSACSLRTPHCSWGIVNSAVLF